MIEIEIIDNGGSTFDRYVVTIGKSVYTMSMHPSDPQGFNQYAGEVDDYDSFEGGKRVTVNGEVLKAILERV